MKPTKFKVWDTVEKRMLIGEIDDVISFDMEGLIYYKGEFRPEYQERFIILQFTGLHDKNGKEICEGDVLAYSGRNVEVIFEESTASFKLKRGIYVTQISKMMQMQLKVIGNIFENPELLEGKK